MDEDDHSEHSGRMGEESTIGDYDTAFAGSMGMLESFDLISRNNLQSPQNYPDEEEATLDDGTLDDATYDSEPDQPAPETADVTELRRGNVTLTPLKFDLTERELLESMPG